MEQIKDLIPQGILEHKTRLIQNTPNTLSQEGQTTKEPEVETILCPKCNKQVPKKQNQNDIEFTGLCCLCKKKKDVLESYPLIFKNVSFESYKVNNKNINAFNHLKDFKIKDETGQFITKGVFLTGNTGTGKTHLIYAFMRKNLIHNKYFYDYVDLLYTLKTEMFEKNNCNSDILKHLCTLNFLVIDDFGNGKVTDWAVEQMNYIINQRYIHGKLTFITSNLPLDGDNSIESYFGARVASRLCAMTTLLILNDKDNRI